MAKKFTYLFLLLLAAGLLSCDHATKGLASAGLRGQPPVVLIGGVLDLRYTENRDVGFSLLRRIPPDLRLVVMLATSTLMSALLLVLWIRRRRAPRVEQLAYALLIAGALGNLLDRLGRGYVVDFIHLHRWPIFNVADICLVLGSGLLLLTTWRLRQAPGA